MLELAFGNIFSMLSCCPSLNAGKERMPRGGRTILNGGEVENKWMGYGEEAGEGNGRRGGM